MIVLFGNLNEVIEGFSASGHCARSDALSDNDSHEASNHHIAGLKVRKTPKVNPKFSPRELIMKKRKQ
jgi:hypothetical protein